MAQIFSKFKINLGNIFPDVLLVVLIMENVDMILVLFDTDSIINYGYIFDNYKKEGFNKEDLNKVKYWFKGCLADEDYLVDFLPLCDEKKEIDEDRWTISLEYSDDINMNYNGYNIYILDKDIETHRNRTIERMFRKPKYNWPIRFIFTSFSLYNNLNGIPDGKSTKEYCKTDYCRDNCKDVPYRKAYNPLST